MIRSLFSLLALIAIPLFSQKPPDPPEAVFKVDTTVRQIDAVVTGKNGRPVEDLTAADFEIVEKRVPHPVEYCSFIPLTGGPAPARSGDGRLLPGDLRRTFVFVLSNPHVTLDGIDSPRAANARAGLLAAAARASLDSAALIEHFVRNRMNPGDLVEILKVDQDTGILAQLTDDKTVLLDAIGKLRKNPLTFGTQSIVVRFNRHTGRVDFLDIMQQNLRAIRVLSAATDQIAGLPGRKVVILAARFMLPNRPGLPEGQVIASRIAELTARANKAGVTIHSVSLASMNRDGAVPDSTDSLYRIANETGGVVVETNDLTRGIERILDLNRGYYLLGYRLADSAALTGGIKVRVKRPGYEVHARSAGLAPGVLAGKSPATETELAAAMASPLALRDLAVNLDVSPVAPVARRGKTRLHYNLNIDLASVEVGRQETGNQGFTLEIAISVAGPDGEYVKFESNTHHYQIEKGQESSFPKQLSRPYDLELTKPGTYQLRALVRDIRSNRAGTAARFVTVPASD